MGISAANMNILENFYFPANYSDSRQRFLAGLQGLGPSVQIENWQIPSQKDSDLFVDSGYWPAQKSPQTLLVVTSGIHGSETYAGSAIQQMVIQEILPKLNRESVGVLLVHAMNPYGFKHHQRTTEAGVNLNRNFSVSGELFKTINQASKDVHEKYFPRTKVTSLKSDLVQSLQMKDGAAFFGDLSLDQLTKAVSPGQFETAEHLEYGGKKLEPQSEMLAEKLRGLMPQYQDIVAIDLHTGLGDENRLHLLTSGSGADLHPALFAQLFDPAKDHVYYEHTPATAEGFYEVHGALNCLFVDLASPKNRVCAITAEFGTLGHSLEAQIEGWNWSMLCHQGRYFGFENSQLAEKANYANFVRSYPQNNIWRKAVIEASRGLFTNVLSRANGLHR